MSPTSYQTAPPRDLMITTVFCTVTLRRDSGEGFAPHYVAPGKKRRHVKRARSICSRGQREQYSWHNFTVCGRTHSCKGRIERVRLTAKPYVGNKQMTYRTARGCALPKRRGILNFSASCSRAHRVHLQVLGFDRRSTIRVLIVLRPQRLQFG